MNSLFKDLSYRFFPLVVLLGLTFSSCQKDGISGDELPHNDDNSSIPIEVENLIDQLGFHSCSIENVEGGYLVEKDMFFDFSTIDALAIQVNKVRENTTGSAADRSRAVQAALAVPLSNARFEYYIDPGFTDLFPVGLSLDWEHAIKTAAFDWKSITECGIIPKRVYSLIPAGVNGVNILKDDNPNLPTIMQNLPANLAGLTCVSNGTNVGRFISINFDIIGFTSNMHSLNLVRHEMGHAVGYRHNVPEGSSTGPCGTFASNIVIPGTSANDVTSIMRQGLKGDYFFSLDDQKGARALYPNVCIRPYINSIDVQKSKKGPGWNIIVTANFYGGTYMQATARAVHSTGGTSLDRKFQQAEGTTEYEIFVDQPGLYEVSVSLRNYKGDCLKYSTAQSVQVQ